MTYSIRHRRLYLVSWRSYYQIRPRPRPPPQRRPCSTLPSWSLPFVTVPPSLPLPPRQTHSLSRRKGGRTREGGRERASECAAELHKSRRGNDGDDRSIAIYLFAATLLCEKRVEGRKITISSAPHVATFFLPAAQTAVLRGADSSLVKGLQGE